MAEKKSNTGLPFNLTTALALLTLVGGLWVASKNPSSSRPNPPAQTPFQSVGDQIVQARLWEDPLDWNTNQPQASGVEAFKLLRSQAARSDSTNRPVLLPVLIHGGPYSEDRESRIRSRFAIVSALGESGYAPEDASHVGAVSIPWPVTADLTDWQTNGAAVLRLFSNTNSPDIIPRCNNILRISFEWYRSRVFNKGGRPPAEQRVLVLWLDENQFEDSPQTRLALLFNEFASTNAPSTNATLVVPLTNLFAKVSLIGPRSSAALRALLPAYGKLGFDADTFSPELRAGISNVLHAVDVFCPTPSAMDAVLVKDGADAAPRQMVQQVLTNFWFNTFHNFSATDAQLAAEALDELRLRQVDLRDKTKHLVLISEWDTFYGRILALTYAAELARYQQDFPNDLDFVSAHLTNETAWPKNLHCFVYQRGLDGQTTKPRDNTMAATDRRQQPSLQDLVDGNLNESKAEGVAQFDYMNRLGDRLLDLQHRLDGEGHGRIDAIGICGSDPYDTLVILQVLRRNFPNTVFFTTDLDARFSHPREKDWARNLVVLSSYGLQLEEKLQGGVAPFRESGQTAQFAATLAALGNTNLTGLTLIPPRRFEVGRDQAFDLSVTNGGLLHPLPPASRLLALNHWPARLALAGVILCGGFLTICFWRRLQRMSWDATQYEIECLWLRREDVGGRQGVGSLMRQLKLFAYDRLDPVAYWLWNSFIDTNPTMVDTAKEASPAEVQAFLDFLNRVVLQNGVPADHVLKSDCITEATQRAFRQMRRERQSRGVFLEKNSVYQMRLHRQVLDDLFSAILKPDASALSDEERTERAELADATQSARMAGEERYRLRHAQRLAFCIGTPVLLAGLVLLIRAAFIDSRPFSGGEPFFFSAGISVWPTECLRLLALALTLIFLSRSYASLRTGVFVLTRAYRLPLTNEPLQGRLWRLPSTPPPQAAVDAAILWEHYQQLGRFWQRVRRIVPLLGAYLIFCFGLVYLLDGLPYSPVRGTISSVWNSVLLGLAVFAFLFLVFWIIDAACLCRWLIERFSESPTRYPAPSLKYFARHCGLGSPAATKDPKKSSDFHEAILAEWIDMQLIAELTARVGRLVYYPFIIFFVLLLSRNYVFDRWPWPPSLIIIFTLNLGLCAASMLILRYAALRAREAGLENLRAKVEIAEQEASPNPEASQAAAGRRLLEELQSLDKGAFAPFWETPLIGAILIPSGGTVLIEVMSYVFH